MSSPSQLEFKNNATGDVRHATTLKAGPYSFVGLPAGTYSLIVSKGGYKAEVYDLVSIHGAVVTDVNTKLQVGAVSGAVVVNSKQSELLEMTSNVIGTTIDQKYDPNPKN